MTKSATLRKVDSRNVKKSAAKAKKKPQLKVVKPSAKKTRPSKTKHIAKRAVVKKAVAKAAPAKAVKPQQAPVKRHAQQFRHTARPVAAPVKQDIKKDVKRAEFRINDHVVYPTHGVGRIVSEETQQIGEFSLRMLVIAFDKDRMTLRVPVSRAATAGLRHISGNDQMARVFVTLKSRARSSRGMWSRRAQEYETKINSGSVISVAEVVRDLHPNVDQAERSYSERMIYESALNRLVGELAAAERTDQKTATDRLMKLLRSKIAA